MTKAIIWRKSVYDTRECPRCGTKLLTKALKLKNVFVQGDNIYCRLCGLRVAVSADYDGPAKPGEKAGRWPGEFPTEEDQEK